MLSNFICPLPWISLSMGARNSSRVCCHSNAIEVDSANGEKLLTLDHNDRIRQNMLLGKIPPACQSCHNLEKANCRSPRLDYLDRFKFDVTSKPIIKYLDITIDNDCNLECIMCSPAYSQRLSSFASSFLKVSVSTRWTTSLTTPMLDKILENLEMITITGGEPLISSKSKQVIEHISHHPRASQIILRLFTNLTHVSSHVIESFQSFKSVELIMSIDSVGENYEHIRYPAKWAQIDRNLKWISELKLPHLDLHIHSVLTAINWPHISELITLYRQRIRGYRIIPLFVVIDTPIFLHPKVLPLKEFEIGREKFLNSLNQLEPKLESQKVEIMDTKNLIDSISKVDLSSRYIDYRVYLSKVASYRKRRDDDHMG